MANGRVVVTDVTVRGGELRIRPADYRHPSLLVRRIVAHDAAVELPLPERIWRAGGVPSRATAPPRPLSR